MHRGPIPGCSLALVLGLLPPAAGVAGAPSSAVQPSATSTSTSTSPSPDTPTPADAPAEPKEAWLDTSHEVVSRGLLWSVERLDRFFSDEREVDMPRASSFVRWRSDLRIRDDGSLAAATDVRAEVHLPAFARRLERLQLAVTGSTVSAADRLLPGESPPDALKRASVGLKLGLFDATHLSLDTQAGVLFQLPVGWYTRLRLRHLHPLPWGRLLAREAVSAFWQTNTGFGTRQDASLEQPLLPWLLARLDATGTATQRSRGWEWETNSSLLATLGATTAASLSAGALSASDLGLVVEKYRVLARVRRDVLRRWIYLEVEPELEWTRRPGGGRQRLRAVIVRLEIQFDAAMLETDSDRSKVVW